MDKFIYSLERTFHLRLVQTPADGNCLFHAASFALARGGLPSSRFCHATIRQMVVDFLRSNKECFVAFQVDDAYLTRMGRQGSWGGEPELIALSNIYVRSIEVYMFSPTGAAVHVRTYTPVLGMETAAPMRFALLPVSGRLEDAPNHYSYLEQVVTVLGASHVPTDPAPVEVVEVDLTCDEPMPMEELPPAETYEDVRIRAEVDAAQGMLAVQRDEPVVAKAAKTKKVSYYKLYEHYFSLGLPQSCADLAARGEVAWYACECGECHRTASFGSEAWAKIVSNEAPVKMTCKLWKPWSIYQTVVRPKLGL